MNPGEAFENLCHDYLTEHYQTEDCTFILKGGMVSTEPDIAVLKKDNFAFYIEAKDFNAQSGQFVLLPDMDKREFIFSPRNKSEQNETTDIIINYMNEDFDRFCNAGTRGEVLDLSSHIFADWIKNYYKSKGVKYVMSCYHDNLIIFPIDEFEKYFEISATYRIKKSGSSAPALKDQQRIMDYISNNIPDVVFFKDGKKIFVETATPIREDKFTIDRYTYLLANREEHRYEIKKLSNTYNMNVIFSIKAIKGQSQADLDEFEADLY